MAVALGLAVAAAQGMAASYKPKDAATETEPVAVASFPTFAPNAESVDDAPSVGSLWRSW